MRFGTNYSYWGNEWKCDYIEVVNKVADIGFDILEIGADHLYHMSEEEIAALKLEGSKRGVVFTTNSGPGKEYDLASKVPEVRNNGINYFKKVMLNMKKLGSKSLVGAIYSFWPSDFLDTDKEGAWGRSIESLKILAQTAEALEIECTLEVLNRYETFILTDCAEAKEFCERIGSKNINILLDTFHMNIEEDDAPQAIRNAGNMLGHLHVGESNRKLPGMGKSIDWDAIGQALRDINYDKGVVMEPFMVPGGEISQDIKVWKDYTDGANMNQLTELLADSLSFLKSKFLKEVK